MRNLTHELIKLGLTDISLLVMFALNSSFLVVLRRIYTRAVGGIHPALHLRWSRGHDLLMIVVALAIVDTLAGAWACPRGACPEWLGHKCMRFFIAIAWQLIMLLLVISRLSEGRGLVK